MQDMLIATLNNPFAAGAGLVAMICLAAWPLCRTRSAMLMTYAGNNLGFMAHYVLLDQLTAAAINGVMGVQTVVAIWLVRWPRLRWIYYALAPALAAGTFLTWHGLPSLLAAAATTLSTMGRMQSNEASLRILLLASTPVWVVHDLIVGSLPRLVADLLSMVIGATMLWKRSPTAHRLMMSALQRIRPRKGFGRPTWHDPAARLVPIATRSGDLMIAYRPERSVSPDVADRPDAGAVEEQNPDLKFSPGSPSRKTRRGTAPAFSSTG
jgi:Bacterial inner membrane protein